MPRAGRRRPAGTIVTMSGPGKATAAGGAVAGAAARTDPRAPTRLVLARHAVTAHTGARLSGRLRGIDLSDDGRRQAATLGERLAPLPITAVYASPIERTVQTAEPVARAHGLATRLLPGVVEADYGDWTGCLLADLAKTDEWKVVQLTPSRARFPAGESIREMQSRTVAALEHVVTHHPGETVVVVSHADPIKSAIAYFTGMHLDLFQRLHVSPASVSVFEFAVVGTWLLKCNDTGTLAELHRPHESKSGDESGRG